MADVELSVESGIATVLINRPDALNSLSSAVMEQLEEVGGLIGRHLLDDRGQGGDGQVLDQLLAGGGVRLVQHLRLVRGRDRLEDGDLLLVPEISQDLGNILRTHVFQKLTKPQIPLGFGFLTEVLLQALQELAAVEGCVGHSGTPPAKGCACHHRPLVKTTLSH